MRYTYLALSLLLCAAPAYAGNKLRHLPLTDTSHVTLDTLEVSAPAGAPLYQPSSPIVWEIKNTRVALNFNWKEKTADAREWIKLHPYFYPTDTIVLDAKGMRIDSVELAGKTPTKLKYTYADNKLTIHFGHTYKSSDTITLYLKYTAMPYATASGGSAAITDDRGLYFINTDYSVPHKPSEIWTQGETEANSHWMITVDKPNTKFTTQIELTVPDSLVTLGNGSLIKQTKGAKGMRTDVWKEDMPIQAYAVMFAIGKFSIIKDKWQNKEVNYYVEPEYAASAKMMFNNTPEMIGYFSQITGIPYPWNKYSQVVVRDYVSGAMENTSASLFGEFMNETLRELKDKNSEDVVSHELFHQWFGDYVTCESWTNITVNESFANYGEQLWRRHKYGDAEGDELAWSDLQTYIYASQLGDPQLVRFNYDGREEVFDAISYNKGGAILHYLHTLIGDAAFNRAMDLYLSKNALHSGEAHQWRLAVEEATGQDMNWFFNQWYFHAGHPNLKITYNYNDSLGKLIVNVNQTQSDSTFNYNMPLKTALIYGNDKTIIEWNITRRKDSFTYNYKNGIKPVLVPDIQHILPGEVKDNKKPQEWLTAYKTCTDYITRRLAISAASKALSDTTSQAIIDLALNDENKSIRRVALSSIAKTPNDKYRKKWTPKVVSLATADKDNSVRAEAFDVLGEWKVASAKAAMISAISDSSYSVAGKALEALNRIDKDTAYAIARKMVDTHPRSTLESQIWSIIGEKGADDDIHLYSVYAPYVQSPKKFSFSLSMNNYLKHVKSDWVFGKTIEIYAQLIITENMKSYRTTLAGFMFQVAGEQKGNLKSDDKTAAATAQKRLDIVKTALQKIIDVEKDPSAKDDLKKMMKDTFDDK